MSDVNIKPLTEYGEKLKEKIENKPKFVNFIVKKYELIKYFYDKYSKLIPAIIETITKEESLIRNWKYKAMKVAIPIDYDDYTKISTNKDEFIMIMNYFLNKICEEMSIVYLNKFTIKDNSTEKLNKNNNSENEVVYIEFLFENPIPRLLSNNKIFKDLLLDFYKYNFPDISTRYISKS